jgi:all-trans-retinol 13,14-reductase
MNVAKTKYDVIIIGSGLSGLLCGYILAKEGMKICILEKNKRFGGCLQSFTRNGQSFDTGVHYFGSMDPGQTLNRYWRYFGLSDSLKLERMNPDGFDRIIIGDKEYPMAMGFENFIEQLLPYFPTEKDILQKYIRSLQEITASFPLYNLELSDNHSELHYRSQGAYDFFQNLVSSGEKHTGNRLASVLAGNNFLYSGNAQTTPLHIPALINHSYISSAWRPVGGSEQIASQLIKKIRDFGGELFSSQEVSKIEITRDIFTIQTLSSVSFSSKFLVSGIAPSKILEMIDPSLIRISTVKRIHSLKNTPSSFAVYLRLKENSIRQLNYNCYIHKSDVHVWQNDDLKEWPGNCMLYTPPYEGNQEYARAMVIITCMNYDEVRKWETTLTGKRGNDYIEFKERKAQLLLKLAEIKFPGLRSCIAGMETSTPLTWRDYTGTPEGSMYGINKEYKRPLETTILPRTKIPRLFFTGQNTNLHGVLGVTIGAVMTCGEITGLEMLLKKIRNG